MTLYAEQALMDLQIALNILDGALVLGVAIPSLFLARTVKQPKLRLLAGLLSGFLLIHGLYHATFVLGSMPGLEALGDLSGVIVEPAGWLLFFIFSVLLWRYSE
ncbi:MAG: hypothetical protein HY296_03800 [Thaumarchaeota archaeon]|nr:hypothetical protein [Nitrososphaerota archaeon]